ncbi:hypothetical protein EV421DRAFT_1893813 [Armillaria borealis]|uniref:Extracellular metalloproteinase n=1 Tax=Armillaria borealis TaxID=47425 RepID=A0AA39ITX5_9AGAR|nr:hypothetical protein EV421DRAFT_1893813 [Armillaria borealis]
MSMQDSGGTNNANFATPPEYTLTTPNRDGALQNDIIVHEFTHGITNRLTGGGTGRCLQTTEAGGMGEVFNNHPGIRTHLYSTDASINYLRYSSIKQLHEVHDIGEVWANMLHNAYAALVEVHGFSSTAMDDPSGTEGNIVWLHLFIDALFLQPCNLTFPNARDPWIQVDQNRYDGANVCTLWNAFASRGLGMNATNYVDDTSVSSGC